MFSIRGQPFAYSSVPSVTLAVTWNTPDCPSANGNSFRLPFSRSDTSFECPETNATSSHSRARCPRTSGM